MDPRFHDPAQGFVVLAEEWWHFEYGTRLWSALTGESTAH
jgi:D-alanyl-D-alanine dipeptidase